MAYTKLKPVKGSIGNGLIAVSKVIKYDMNEKKTTQDSPKESEEQYFSSSISNIINYTSDEDKIGEQRFISTINCTEEGCINEMILTKQHFGERGNRVMYHGVQSFKPGEITPEAAHKMGVMLANELWGDRFEVVVTTHLDREHIHNHFAINSVSFVDGRKFVWDTEYKNMQQVSDRLCREYGLTIIEKDKDSGHTHRGAMRAESEGRYTLESIVKEDIDACILCSRNIKEWHELMNSKGYTINNERKYLRVYPYGHSKPIRVDRRFSEKYGADYTLDGIALLIAENVAKGGYIDRNILLEKEPREDIGYIVDTSIVKSDKRVKDVIYEYRNPIKVNGIQKTYNRYLINLGVFPYKKKHYRTARIARTHYLLREDLLKLDKYIAENNFLIQRGISDTKTLNEVKIGESKELNHLYKERNGVRNRIRRADEYQIDVLKERLSELNGEIKEQRRIVFYCNDILRSINGMEDKLDKIASEEKTRNMNVQSKTDTVSNKEDSNEHNNDKTTVKNENNEEKKKKKIIIRYDGMNRG